VIRLDGVIALPPERLFALLEDPRVADELNPDYLRTAVERTAWMPKAGSRTEVTLHYREVAIEFETEIAEYRRGQFLLERQVRGPFKSFEHAINLEAAGDATRLSEVLAYALPLGTLGWIFDRLAVRKDLETALATRQARLREIAGGR
jgi:ligand-binding SRPBCC domain-containing protein